MLRQKVSDLKVGDTIYYRVLSQPDSSFAGPITRIGPEGIEVMTALFNPETLVGKCLSSQETLEICAVLRAVPIVPDSTEDFVILTKKEHEEALDDAREEGRDEIREDPDDLIREDPDDLKHVYLSGDPTT